MEIDSLLRSEEVFTELLRNAAQGTHKVNRGEKAVFYRVLQESYNPLGIYFCVLGAAVGYSLSWTTASRKGVVTVACALYAREFSWWLLDPQPTRRFFRDIVSVDGRVREEVLLSHKALSSPKIEVLSPFWSAIHFLTLSRSLQKRSSKRSTWKTLLPPSWCAASTMDPLTALYWHYLR